VGSRRNLNKTEENARAEIMTGTPKERWQPSRQEFWNRSRLIIVFPPYPPYPLGKGGNPADLLRAHQTEQLGADLVDAAFVGFAFLMQDGGNFRGGFETSLGLLLNLDIDHFLQQAQKCNRMHD